MVYLNKKINIIHLVILDVTYLQQIVSMQRVKMLCAIKTKTTIRTNCLQKDKGWEKEDPQKNRREDTFKFITTINIQKEQNTVNSC